ncbi:hypothetical protein [Yoonia maritima]|uniref:hypothetical protein n=1 Tax=Yoonia maritima TaxID=1435347 RepID=UPI0013A64C24|nr:hypothetical protein [Yoonia maritima]
MRFSAHCEFDEVGIVIGQSFPGKLLTYDGRLARHFHVTGPANMVDGTKKVQTAIEVLGGPFDIADDLEHDGLG